jgi:hypothetical protein
MGRSGAPARCECPRLAPFRIDSASDDIRESELGHSVPVDLLGRSILLLRRTHCQVATHTRSDDSTDRIVKRNYQSVSA